jgi:aryl-alcohol dehydrogenase-like predicted oxidoreductase
MHATGPVQRPSSLTAPLSELGFGCAAVAGRVSRRDSLAALAAAYDAGITLYDTARSYGYGESEGIVGDFLRGRRDSVVLCTKFGILPARQGGWKQKLKPAARGLLRLFPGLRKTVRRRAADQFVPGQFTLETLRTSFDTSLRELKTDYVDILLLHAAPASVLAQDDLLEALERLVESGKVRMAGISAELPVIARYFVERPPVLATAQFALNLANLAFTGQTRANGDLLLVANHPFGGPTGAAHAKTIVASLGTNAALPQALRDKLDPRDPQLLPELVLNCVLRGTGVRSVLAAMMQPRHIASNVAAVANCRFTLEELDQLRAFLRAQPANPPA